MMENEALLSNTTGLPGTLQILLLDPTPTIVSDLNGLNADSDLKHYDAVYKLQRPVEELRPTSLQHLSDGVDSGSHLDILNRTEGRPVIFQTVEADQRVLLECGANKEGYLEDINISGFTASGFHEALVRTYRAVSVRLSILSFDYDIPLRIHQIDLTEAESGRRLTARTIPYKDASFTFTEKESKGYLRSERYLFYTSLYREAMASGSANYQFLCYFRIIEGLHHLFAAINKAIEQDERKYHPFSTRIPSTPDSQKQWLGEIFPAQSWDDLTLKAIFVNELVGETLSDVFGALHGIRNRIAHGYLTKSKELTFKIDEFQHAYAVNRYLPLTKCVARFLLVNDWDNRIHRVP